MKNKTYLSLFIIMHILLAGCHQGVMQKRLSEIDHLVDKELKDTTAYNMLITCKSLSYLQALP
ncbi:hypothetical protein E5358_13640 [Palleniella muris]|uniref:Uncharacterized protein n=1 Tax=Palleniella muris TaxID=3038145 RepID=A0AC61QM58_9BACT|nr:hypothetical protein [Palleniella muris]TGX80164.1 hypothetical protein E5358_13640 [Palleniella muris]